MSVKLYKRADGIEGVGFIIDRAGLRMHSVAWPDGIAQRYTLEELERKRIVTAELVKVSADSDDPDAASMSDVVDELLAVKEELQDAKDNYRQLAKENVNLNNQIEELKNADGTDESAGDTKPPTAAPGDATAEGDEATEPSGDEASEDDAAADTDEPEAEESEKTLSEAAMIRKYLEEYPEETNAQIIEAFKVDGVEITSSQVSRQRRKLAEARSE